VSGDQATPAVAGPVVHMLLVPVVLRNAAGEEVQTITELTLHRLKGAAARKCMNAYQRGPGDFAMELVCASARIPPTTFDQLDAEDVMALTEKATPFFASGPATPKV
jgi:hypothetical protein